jgi:hypothetical protein
MPFLPIRMISKGMGFGFWRGNGRSHAIRLMLPLPHQAERFGALHDVEKRAGSTKKLSGVIWRRTCRYSLPQIGVVCVQPRIAIVDLGFSLCHPIATAFKCFLVPIDRHKKEPGSGDARDVRRIVASPEDTSTGFGGEDEISGGWERPAFLSHLRKPRHGCERGAFYLCWRHWEE